MTQATQRTAEEDPVLRCPDICYRFHLDSGQGFLREPRRSGLTQEKYKAFYFFVFNK